MSTKNCIDKDISLSKSKIAKLKKVYKNYRILLDHLYFDVKNIMFKGITKEKAIHRILNIID